jgi:hypothetical protein
MAVLMGPAFALVYGVADVRLGFASPFAARLAGGLRPALSAHVIACYAVAALALVAHLLHKRRHG